MIKNISENIVLMATNQVKDELSSDFNIVSDDNLEKAQN